MLLIQALALRRFAIIRPHQEIQAPAQFFRGSNCKKMIPAVIQIIEHRLHEITYTTDHYERAPVARCFSRYP